MLSGSSCWQEAPGQRVLLYKNQNSLGGVRARGTFQPEKRTVSRSPFPRSPCWSPYSPQQRSPRYSHGHRTGLQCGLQSSICFFLLVAQTLSNKCFPILFFSSIKWEKQYFPLKTYVRVKCDHVDVRDTQSPMGNPWEQVCLEFRFLRNEIHSSI